MSDYSLDELLAAMPPDKVSYQMLSSSMTNITTRKDGLSNITFRSDAITADEVGRGPIKTVGIVVWLPADEVRKFLDENNKPDQPDQPKEG